MSKKQRVKKDPFANLRVPDSLLKPKSIHVSFDKDEYIKFMILMFKYDLEPKEVFRNLVKLFISGHKQGVRILEAMVKKKMTDRIRMLENEGKIADEFREESVNSLSEQDTDVLYDLMAENDGKRSETDG